MELTYIYHSGFILECERAAIIIDYYRNRTRECEKTFQRLLRSDKDLYILISHSHHDHFNWDIVRWKTLKKNITYILSTDVLDKKRLRLPEAIYLKKQDSYQDKYLNIKAYGSTDQGISFYIEADGKKYFHAGDLNNWHWNQESNPEEIEDAENAYYHELEAISADIKYLDLVLFPIDPRLGKDFMKGAKEFIETIQVNTFAPMHFSSDPDKIKLFEPIAHTNQCQYICWKFPGERVTI